MPDANLPDDSLPMIDIHCHQPNARTDVAIRSLDTHEWATAAPAFLTYPDTTARHAHYFSLGVHPWFIEQQDAVAALALIDRQSQNPAMLAIGECGLDLCIATPIDKQIEIFNQQLALAERLHKPLIIHCVRAFNELLRIKKSSPHQQPWIVHGYNNNLQIARQLLARGCYLSFGKALLNADSRACNILPKIALDRLFLETDAAENISIDQIYAAAARILALDIATLSEQLHRNFNRVFLDD